MEIYHRLSKVVHPVVISTVSSVELKTLIKRHYWFDWKLASKTADLFKLTLDSSKEILGLIALINDPRDSRIEIKLLASSRKNVGVDKEFEGIVTCLIGFACGEALARYGDVACVSLVPKTVLKKHYISRYNMMDAGKQIFLEGKPLFDLVKKCYKL